MNESLEYLMSEIEDRRKMMVESLGDGAPKTFEEYKFAAGVVRGLLTAQGIIADLAKRMENSDE